MKFGIIINTNEPETVWNAFRFGTTLFVEHKGQIFACGTCLKIRQMPGSDVCPISTMHDMLHIVEESDKVLVFG